LATTASARLRRERASRVSLERALSKLGLASRSEARTLILAGRVHVNGRPATDPAARVTPEHIAIAIDGESAPRRSAAVTIALHKPRGYVTTRSDPERRKTVYDLLADLPERVVPVGRLDLATSGLLLFTNDTQLANWLTDPANAIPRVYLVTVTGRLDGSAIATLHTGMQSGDERLSAHTVAIRKASEKETHLTLTLTEGKNREVRRLLEAVGHRVTRLKRVQYGDLTLGDLPPGTWRRVGEAELRAAFPGYARRNRVPRPK
jgi:23S rRNA pseudouridine2605 synthase